MSLFSSITNFVNHPIQSIEKATINTLNTVSGAFDYPITAITQGLGASTQKFLTSSIKDNTIHALTTTAAGVGALVAIDAAATAGVVKTAQTVVTAAIQHPKTSVALGLTLPVIAVSQKAQQAVENLPSNVVNFGSNVGKAIDKPTISNVANIVKENPVISGILAGAATLAVAKGATNAVNAIETYANTNAVKANTNATVQSNVPSPIQLPQPIQQTPIPTAAVVAPPSAEAPVAVKKVTKKKKKKKKSTKKKKTRRSKKKKSTKKKKRKTIKRSNK